jgi:hypothetical protein
MPRLDAAPTELPTQLESAATKISLLRSLKRPPEAQSKTERSQRKNKNGERDAINAEEPPTAGLEPA